jgi:hypothetical protein
MAIGIIKKTNKLLNIYVVFVADTQKMSLKIRKEGKSANLRRLLGEKKKFLVVRL